MVGSPLFEQACRVPRRNLADDPTFLQFVGNFSACPLADGTACFGRSLAGQDCHLRPLFYGKFGNRSWTRGILQSLDQTPCFLLTRFLLAFLLSRPAISPETHGIHIDAPFARNLTIGSALRRSQDDACSHHHLLFVR